MIWQEAAGWEAHRVALDALALRVASLSHSASLVRLAFEATKGVGKGDGAPLWHPDPDGRMSLRVPYAGRLRDLADWFARDERPRSGVFLSYRAPSAIPKPEAARSVFGGAGDWIVFEDSGDRGARPDLLAFAHVAKRVRASLMQHGPQPSPGVISGHAPNGKATAEPHLAILPLANVGNPYATGDLLGFAIVLPRPLDAGDRHAVLEAIAGFAHLDRGEDACALLHLSDELTWRIERAAAPSRSSLKAERWCGVAERWASATPVLLDRFPDHGSPVEEGRLIAAACRNTGLPEPVEIEIHKHSALSGAPSAYPARGSQSRPDWSFPRGVKFADRPRRHVMLRFAEPIEGPVILGAGRFHGFGLCRPLPSEQSA